MQTSPLQGKAPYTGFVNETTVLRWSHRSKVLHLNLESHTNQKMAIPSHKCIKIESNDIPATYGGKSADCCPLAGTGAALFSHGRHILKTVVLFTNPVNLK